MKKLALVTALSIALSATALSPAHATGIPVIDVAGLLQMVVDGAQQAQQFAQQISEAKNRLNELKSQGEHYKGMVEGHYNFEDILYDPNLNGFINMDDWKDVYHDTSQLSSLRSEFGLTSDNAATQQRYDRKLQEFYIQQRFYKASVKRNEMMSDLVSQFSTAKTPSAKEDIANAISLQQTQLENDKQMMSSMSDLMERQRTLEATAEAKARTSLLLGDGIDTPPYKKPNT
jgi:type IV secretion system protein VirB5